MGKSPVRVKGDEGAERRVKEIAIADPEDPVITEGGNQRGVGGGGGGRG